MECTKGVLRNVQPKFHIVEIRILPTQGYLSSPSLGLRGWFPVPNSQIALLFFQ